MPTVDGSAATAASIHGMSVKRLPVLLEDGSSLDWTDATYKVDVSLRANGAVIEHTMIGCPALEELVGGGDAEWVTEVRCPRTLLSRQHSGRSRRQDVSWSADEVVGDVFLLPGLVVVRDGASITAPPGLNEFVWPHAAPLLFPEGFWLAKGQMCSVTPLVASLIRFRRDPDGRLKAGQMAVEESSDGPAPYFRVDLAADLYDKRREERDVQLAGLIAAFGLLPGSSLAGNGDHADSQIANRLRAELEANGVADWDEESYDPAHAATTLETFHVSDEEDADDD